MKSLDKTQCVFISRIQLANNPMANERLRFMPEEDYEYCVRSQGYWVKHGSRTHNLALIMGIEPYGQDHNWHQTSGTWDRTGRIR